STAEYARTRHGAAGAVLQNCRGIKSGTGVDGITLTAVAAAFFCGGVVKGMVGIGLPLTTIALLTLFLDLRIAVPLMVVPILATNILQSFRGGRFVELLRRYWLMLAGGAVGVWVGAA